MGNRPVTVGEKVVYIRTLQSNGDAMARGSSATALRPTFQKPAPNSVRIQTNVGPAHLPLHLRERVEVGIRIKIPVQSRIERNMVLLNLDLINPGEGVRLPLTISSGTSLARLGKQRFSGCRVTEIHRESQNKSDRPSAREIGNYILSAGGAIENYDVRMGPEKRDNQLEAGDLIIAADGLRTRNPGDLARILAIKRPDQSIDLTVVRSVYVFKEVIPVEHRNEYLNPTMINTIAHIRLNHLRPALKGRPGFLEEPSFSRTASLPIQVRTRWFGIGNGCLVDAVEPSSAIATKLERGDIIFSIDGTATPEPATYFRVMRNLKPGSASLLGVIKRHHLTDFSTNHIQYISVTLT